MVFAPQIECLSFGPRFAFSSDKIRNGHFDLAVKVATLSSGHRCRLGAVIAYKSSVVSVGQNQIKTHPKQAQWSNRAHLRPYLHAEIHALTRVSKAEKGMLLGSTVYVARVLANGSLGASRPCAGCMSALKAHGVRYAVYSENNNIYKELISKAG